MYTILTRTSSKQSWSQAKATPFKDSLATLIAVVDATNERVGWSQYKVVDQ